jgi:hypothetical protein
MQWLPVCRPPLHHQRRAFSRTNGRRSARVRGLQICTACPPTDRRITCLTRAGPRAAHHRSVARRFALRNPSAVTVGIRSDEHWSLRGSATVPGPAAIDVPLPPPRSASRNLAGARPTQSPPRDGAGVKPHPGSNWRSGVPSSRLKQLAFPLSDSPSSLLLGALYNLGRGRLV